MYLPKVNRALHMENLLLDGKQSIFFYLDLSSRRAQDD